MYLDLKENPRGRYLKITEKSYGQRSTIIVPEQGVGWFVDMFGYYASGGDVQGAAAAEELQVGALKYGHNSSYIRRHPD